MRRHVLPILVLSLTLAFCSSAHAQLSFHPLRHPEDSIRIRGIVEGFFSLAIGKAFPADSIPNYAIEPFAKLLAKMSADPLWRDSTTFQIGRITAVSAGDEAVIATATTQRDTFASIGPLVVDWVFYMSRDTADDWRISMLRRMSGTDDAIANVTFLDTTTTYPTPLKREIIREESALLMSNAQLREHFIANRAGFAQLLEEFSRKDSLKILGRIDRRVQQLNTHGIVWDIAAHDVPKEVIDEYMKTASKAERSEMQRRLKLAASLRRDGQKKVAKLAQDAGLSLKRIDSVITMMRAMRISFINTVLPWTDAVQFTVAGSYSNALGYLYSPHGQMPIIDPNEYYYLEEIGDGWWIFRTT